MQQAIQKRVTGLFPFGTLAVNILGCFAIGVIYGLAAKNNINLPTTGAGSSIDYDADLVKNPPPGFSHLQDILFQELSP